MEHCVCQRGGDACTPASQRGSTALEHLEGKDAKPHCLRFIFRWRCWGLGHNPDHAQAYVHAYELASCFAELPMGVEVLVQIDRLVQLLETPAFNFLRLQLLHPARYPALLWCAPRPPAQPC